jgi:hypothetical protein
MKSIPIDENSIVRFNNRSFLPLGRQTFRSSAEKFLPDGNADGIWGILDWKENDGFNLQGILQYSEDGNFDEGGNYKLTINEIEDLKSINPLLDGRTKVVRERFINFDEVIFTLPETFHLLDLPRIRLTLFLKPVEGALVYYQHSRREDHQDEEAIFEYIMSEDEAEANRDRLEYFFTIEPKFRLIQAGEDTGLYRVTEEDAGMSFIIKVLTYDQNAKTEDELLKESIAHLNNQNIAYYGKNNLVAELFGKDKYNLLIFSPVSSTGESIIVIQEDGEEKRYGGRFVPVTQSGQVDPSKRTLLLIHGTFVNTMKSFKDLILCKGIHKDQPSYLQYLLSSGSFEQVLAFDHPTISENAIGNTEWLLGKLKQLNLSFENNPLNIVTTSRGALVAEYIASSRECEKVLPVGKILMFSAANGCGYFSTFRMISKAVTVWRNTVSGPAAKVVLAIAQLSIRYFCSQPGCIMMTIKHNDGILESILGGNPNNPKLIYKCIVSDWDTCLLGDRFKLFKGILDTAIRISLGKKHDWVIGAERQDLVPQASMANRALTEFRRAVHGRYLEVNYTTDIDCVSLVDPHHCIEEFFRN